MLQTSSFPHCDCLLVPLQSTHLHPSAAATLLFFCHYYYYFFLHLFCLLCLSSVTCITAPPPLAPALCVTPPPLSSLPRRSPAPTAAKRRAWKLSRVSSLRSIYANSLQNSEGKGPQPPPVASERIPNLTQNLLYGPVTLTRWGEEPLLFLCSSSSSSSCRCVMH